GPVSVGPSTVVGWRHNPPRPNPSRPAVTTATTTATPTASPATQATTQTESVRVLVQQPEPELPKPVPVADLAGARLVAQTLTVWFDLLFSHPSQFVKPDTTVQLGVLLAGPEAVGKTTVVHSVAHADDLPVSLIAGPSVAVLEPNAAVAALEAAVERA